MKRELADAARSAAKNAYHPITRSAVGAAILTKEGKIYTGCNVQSDISGLGCCAEQCAVHHAVAHGAYNYTAVAVCFPEVEPVKPCGACLQVLNEFAQIADEDITIYLVNVNGDIVGETTVRTELRDAWGPRIAGKDLSAYEQNKDS